MTSNRYYFLSLVLGVTLVSSLIGLSSDVRFPYRGQDGPGYVEEARNYIYGKGVIRSPSLLADPLVDYHSSGAFPPSFALFVGISAGILGLNPVDAVCWVSWSAWILLPLVFMYALSPLLGHARALACGFIAALSPSHYEYSYLALSDTFFLLLTAISLGLLLRAFSKESNYSSRLMFAAGMVAAIAYSVRNAGVAIIAVIPALMVAATVLKLLHFKRAAKIGLVWACGWLVVASPLFVRNVISFGSVNPYGETSSHAGFGVITSIRMYLEAFLFDMSGSKWIAAFAWDYRFILTIVMPAFVFFMFALWQAYRYQNNPQKLMLLAVVFYVVAGSAMVILGRYLFDWVETSLLRHIMQYSWLVLALIVLLIPAKFIHILLVGGVLLLSSYLMWMMHFYQQEMFLGKLIAVANTPREVNRLAPNRWILNEQLHRYYFSDKTLKSTLVELPCNALIASNLASVVKLLSERSSRHLSFESPSQAGLMISSLAVTVEGKRPLYILLLATNGIIRSDKYDDSWQQQFIRSIDSKAEISAQSSWWILLKVLPLQRNL